MKKIACLGCGILSIILVIMLIVVPYMIIGHYSSGNMAKPTGQTPGSSAGGSATCADLSVATIDNQTAILEKIQANKSVYEKAAKEAGIAWEMVAALHYREHNNDPGNPSNGEGPFQLTTLKGQDPDNIALREFEPAAIYAAKFLKNKVGGKLSATADNELIKDAFLRYNGKVSEADVNPYVMNNFDASHQKMQWPPKHSLYPARDTRDGAFTVYAFLRYSAKYDGGKITAKDCSASSGGSSTIKGSYAAPIRGLKKDMLKPHHDGSPAVDLDVPNGTELFAVTSGQIVNVYRNTKHIEFVPGTRPPPGSCGTGLLLKGTDDVSYTYCHFESLAPEIKVGGQVTAGQFVGKSDNTGRTTGPHLHLSASGGGMNAEKLRQLLATVADE